ncbi:MAG: FAD-dependent oxidoreductase [Anaerolineae bacterium]|nr:FAD-dependent oxidoreductase [Anaerolineae bacterium]
MGVGIIGGGLMGMALAYHLARQGEQVTVLEQDSELGGLNGELRFDDGLRVARYQHAILPIDRMLYNLCTELGLQDDLLFQNAHAGFVHGGQIYAMTNILDFLTFPMLGLIDRFRLGGVILRARSKADWRELDELPVKEWLVRVGGVEAFERVWRPLLEAKFDGVYDHVSATYIWAWLNRMSSIRRVPQMNGSIGYLRRGHFSLIQSLAEALLRLGGKIEYNARVREIELGDGRMQRIRTQTQVKEFDVVVAAIATPNFLRLIPGADNAYKARLTNAKYLGLICPVLVVEKRLSPYWTLNLTDPTFPFSVIIETPHPEHPSNYVVYLPRYTAPDNDWMGVSDEDIREAWFSHLHQIFPTFDEAAVRHFAVSRSRYVEPVYLVNNLANDIGILTPYDGLYLANTRQTYPELPTSEAVIKHAQHVASVISKARPASTQMG